MIYKIGHSSVFQRLRSIAQCLIFFSYNYKEMCTQDSCNLFRGVHMSNNQFSLQNQIRFFFECHGGGVKFIASSAIVLSSSSNCPVIKMHPEYIEINNKGTLMRILFMQPLFPFSNNITIKVCCYQMTRFGLEPLVVTCGITEPILLSEQPKVLSSLTNPSTLNRTYFGLNCGFDKLFSSKLKSEPACLAPYTGCQMPNLSKIA